MCKGIDLQTQIKNHFFFFVLLAKFFVGDAGL